MMNREELKRAIYESLSKRRRKFIDKIGYDRWDPFQEPNHPIEIRRDFTNRTAAELARDFLATRRFDEYNLAFARGVYDFCLGIFSKDERYRGMFEFVLWYAEELKKKGIEPSSIWEKD